MDYLADGTTVLSNEIQLHIPEDGISALSNDLLNSFEKSNQEHDAVKDRKTENTDSNEKEHCVGSVVANHYNQLLERGVAERKESRIFHMRNLNNWIKSRIIGNILDRIRRENGSHCRLNVLDLGCGKGGDLLKWERGNVHHVVCADIAETSIEQCKDRYATLKHRSRSNVFSAEFIAADCSKENIMERMANRELKLDLVSCQFAFHYSFESLPQAEQMLANVSSNLQPGGYFIGTTTDAEDIMRRLGRKEYPENRKFGNSIFSVEFPIETPLDPPPLFGAKYNFHLEEVVDCPEFLVHFPTFQKLASKYGLTLVQKTRFEEFVIQELDQGKDLLMRMKALEAYPPYGNQRPVSQDSVDYEHVQEYLDSSSNADGFRPKVGTLSKAEWEAVSLYLVYIFRKEDLTTKDRKRRLSTSSNEEANSRDKGKKHVSN
uniref:mRNA cap guanine-N(7) methyltransferase n=1 Tax=Daphnia pulex TaxID=6669 RepID=A0A4Y7MSA2_DAPPU|nr:EOG090X07I2 [Daphnia pulex]